MLIMPDRPIREAGIILIACSVCGIGITHFVLPGLRPILAPIPPEALWSWVGPVAGGIFIVAGFLLAIKRTRLGACLFLGVAFLLLFTLGHLPNRIRYNPEILAFWTDTLKLLAMTGAMMTIALFSKEWGPSQAKWLSKGKYAFALMLVVFGIDHYLYVDFVSTMVPSWIPGPRPWTYATGVALIAAGVAIFTNILFKLATRILTLMLVSWLFMVHIPDTLKNPIGDGSILIGMLTCVFFIGIAMMHGWSAPEQTSVFSPGQQEVLTGRT